MPRVGGIQPQPGRPVIGDFRQRRVEVFTQLGHGTRQRIVEVAIQTGAKAHAAHVHGAAEMPVLVEQRDQIAALLGVQKRRRQGVAVPVEVPGDARPVQLIDAFGN